MWLLQISDFILVCAMLHCVKCVVLFWETCELFVNVCQNICVLEVQWFAV